MADQESIRCMQLPMASFQMLLPNSAVAEIIGYIEPEIDVDEADWFVGRISWRGVLVPVVSIEKMCGQAAVKPGPRSRIAIVYHPEGDKALPYLGLILQDIPRAYLAEQDRLQDVVEEESCEFLLGSADIMLEHLVIPDIDAIADRIKMSV